MLKYPKATMDISIEEKTNIYNALGEIKAVGIVEQNLNYDSMENSFNSKHAFKRQDCVKLENRWTNPVICG